MLLLLLLLLLLIALLRHAKEFVSPNIKTLSAPMTTVTTTATTTTTRGVVFVGGKPGNFPLTGSDLPSHWFV